MPGQKKINKNLKKAILKDLRDNNQRIFDPRQPPFKKKPAPVRKKTYRSTRRSVFVMAMVASAALFYLFLAGGLPSRVATFYPGADSTQETRAATTPSPSMAADSPGAIPIVDVPLAGDNFDLPPWPRSPVETGSYARLLDNKNVRLSTLFGLGIRSVVIDPGHGGRDPGAIGALGTREKDITLAVARMLKKRLDRDEGLKIYLTRETDKTVSLSDRVRFANVVGADLFISIHVNSLPKKDLNIIETYSFGPPADEETLQLAKRENADSMYSAGDFKKLIRKIGDTMKQQESIVLATAIQRSLFANIKKYDKDVHNWGVKVAPFMVLLNVEAPAVLSEISCISNEEEEKKLKTTDYQEKIASFIEKGMIVYLAQKGVRTQRGEKHAFEKNG